MLVLSKVVCKHPLSSRLISWFNVVIPACRKIWEAFIDNEVLLNGESVKKKSTSVRRVSACLYH